jgi:hypothetical protein
VRLHVMRIGSRVVVLAAMLALGACARGPEATDATVPSPIVPSDPFTLDPESGIERQITHGSRDYGADWSPDGTRIV